MNIVKLYVDNFRGFQKTSLSISKVNFFVGENSTGKTSLLKLVDLIASSEFWFNGNFRTDNVDLSYYGDISIDGDSTNVSRGKETKIGVMYESIEDNEPAYSCASLVLTAGEGNKTTLKSLKFAYADMELTILKSKSSKNIRYKLKSGMSFTPEKFQKWVEAEVDRSGYRVSKAALQPFMNNSPFFMVNILAGDAFKRASETEDRSLPSMINTASPYTWIAPIRIKPQLTYDGNVYEYSAEGAHAPYVLKNILGKKATKSSQALINSLERFGKESKLFDSINVKQFSKEGNSPFRIEVVLDGQSRHIGNVGYGVSQIFPIIVEVLNHTGYRFAIQQPEVHLHPKAQASLGGFIYDTTKNYGTHFIIETHSDFLIDRYRQRMSKDKDSSSAKDAQVIFFERSKDRNIARTVTISEDGSYSEDQPAAFRKFFYDEEINNLAI